MTDTAPKISPAEATTEMVIALINQLTPEVRSEVVFLLVSTHIQESHAERELPLVISQCLDEAALGVGVLVISRAGPIWRTCHKKNSARAEDVERVLDVVTCHVEGAIEGIADELGLALVRPS